MENDTSVFKHIDYKPNIPIKFDYQEDTDTNVLTFGNLHIFMTTKQAQDVCSKINAALRMKEGTEGLSNTKYFSEAIAEMGTEYFDATRRYPPMNSPHEGFAILKEEVDELWDEVKQKPGRMDYDALRKECIQVGAMAIRFYTDVCREQE